MDTCAYSILGYAFLVRVILMQEIEVTPVQIRSAITTPFKVLTIIIIALLTLFIALNAD